MLAAATRDHPVQWSTLLHDTLAIVGLTPTPATVAALNAITSYAASPPSLYSDAATGPRDAKAYAALLLALHTATASWPAVLQEAVAPPPVCVGDCSIPVSGAAMEAFVVLYSAAVCNCAVGSAAMARARADHARNATRGSVSSAVPNSNSKAAYR
ncbi:hypothetical protein DQ04_16401010, partial [Trypanosoma grayi]|uniref:hypothetical protein n=1 Tax=Trypanosoma grayi TaxID=71804 RepID=UPI0004F47802